MISNLFKTVKNELTQKLQLFIPLIIIIVAAYSVYFFGEKNVNTLGEEDGLFEYLTALFFLLASLTLFRLFIAKRNVWILLLALLLFFGFGEEISWGQRILGFGTPESLSKLNVQGETTLHNIEFLNDHDFDHTQKTGLRKLLTVDFLYKIFCFSFGGILPLAVLLFSPVKQLINKMRVPVPSLVLGSFFIFNWLLFKFIKGNLLPDGYSVQYYDSIGEISEFNSAVIFFVLSLDLFLNRKSNVTKAIEA
ncbi:MAG: hypothetical protein MUC73_00065 [Cyclobacteriaceae bacterium]|jgi:hypothetical protein|nr:hypothetical protein [Cyclobacteriaceae bacterium]